MERMEGPWGLDSPLVGIEELIVWPPTAEDIFRLTREDLEKFVNEVTRIFTNYGRYIDLYKESKGELCPYPHNPLTFYGFRLGSGRIHQVGWDAKIFFDGDHALPIRLNRKPKIAFLPDKRNPNYTRGLYISQGRALDHPWVPRDKFVYVIKS